ncbi:hypothetical protein [Pseudonocardia sp. ICBG1293]|uniref:hypothetical protein n=1 Tax=Pseudonocardia sp. ICBG1293 TaxID=2844382 RepID=UPI001CCD4D05|nr:hypothetical protein [Pseudonocardia sp. ICBG1293]
MRHLVGILVGLVGTAVALAVAGAGMGIASESMMRMDLDRVPAGSGLLFVGGLLLGAVVLAARLSPGAPLAGAVLLLGGSAWTLVDPQSSFALGRGLGYLLSLQYGMLLAGLLAVAAFVVPRRRAEPGPPPSWAQGPSSGPVVH